MKCFVCAGDVKNAAHFRYAEETKLAWEEGKLCADITEEQRKLTEADLIIFQVYWSLVCSWSLSMLHTNTQPTPQFPMYWFTVPAIMKGWMDRVLTLGYAYSEERRYSQGIFKVTAPLKGPALLGLSQYSSFFWFCFFLHRTRKPCCPSPLGLMSPCLVQMVLMETWMWHCGHYRYCIGILLQLSLHD